MHSGKWYGAHAPAMAGAAGGGGTASYGGEMPSNGRERRGCGWRRDGRPPYFKTWELVTMILGFVFFFPVGLAMLFYVIGRNKGWWGDARDWAHEAGVVDMARRAARRTKSEMAMDTGNTAFDTYRKSELERLEEERRRLDTEAREFREFLERLRKAKDEEEFNRFMAERRAADANARPATGAGPTGPMGTPPQA